MIKSYTSNYLKIYIWNGLAIVTKFLSFFIVIPYLSSNPSIYGIYSICVSLGIFLNYADLGFLGASQKYAAEAYAIGDREKEMRYIGNAAFILLGVSIFITILFGYFAFFPHVLIKNLNTPQKIHTASGLLFILTTFTPVIVLRRTVETIFKIRIDDFISKKIFIIGNIITISSVFYFFANNQYKIVSYYLFLKTIDLTAIIVSLWIAKKRYNYDFLSLLKHIHFDKNVFIKIKHLAIVGLYLMIIWVLFYEADKIFIGKFIGPEKAAIYSIALLFPAIFRQIFGTFFSPFVSRSNHFIGVGDEDGLKKLILQLLILSAPITILPPIALALTVKPLILSMAGLKYLASINITIFLSLSYSLSFITYTTSIVLNAKVKIKIMYIAGIIPLVIFWPGIFFSYQQLGLLSFGFFKFLGLFVTQIVYLFILLNYLEISFKKFFNKVIKPLIFSVIFLISSLLFFDRFLPCEKSKLNLLVVAITSFTMLVISFIILYFTSSDIKIYFKNNIVNGLFRKVRSK